jgi:hypothetical protein
MKIRLMGTEDECRELAGRLPAIVDVLEVSEPRANRGDSCLVRVYIETRPYPGTGPHVTAPAEAADEARPRGRRRRALPPGGAG